MPKLLETCRIDKWLWSVRLYKTRTIATDAVKGGKVKVNDAIVKPSFDVHVGNIISINKFVVKYQFKVVGVIDNRVGAPFVKLYCEDITPEDEKKKLTDKAFMPAAFRDRGAGRPTKKERRDLDDWMDMGEEE